MTTRCRTTRLNAVSLTRHALIVANPETQRPVLERLLATGFEVSKVLTVPGKAAIALRHAKSIGWLTADGKFHRPIKGQATVSINNRTLERVW